MMMPSNLINSIGFYMPNVLVTYYYGIEAGGFYTLAQRLMGVPMTLIGRSIGDVFLGEFSRLTRDDKRAAWRLFVTMLVRLVAVSALCMAVLFAVQPEWCVAIFGLKWGNVAHVLKILSACYVGQLIVAPLAQSMIVLHRQRTLLIWDMCRTPILLACIVAIARHGGGVNTALLTYSSVTGAFYLLLLLLIVVTLRRELLDHDPGGRKGLVVSSVEG